MLSIIFLWLFIIGLIVVLLKLININKNYILCFLISLLIVLFFVNLNISMSSAIDGAKLWFKAMVPTLFPFLVICNLLISYDGISLYSKLLGPIFCRPLGLSKICAFPLTASFLCGYPLGAKYCTDIFELGYIDKNEYIRLLNIASNCGPLFIVGSVSTVMLGNQRFGYLLLIANYLSLIVIGLLTKNKSTLNTREIKTTKSKSNNFGQSFKESIENALNTTLQIGGFIIIFSVLIGIIKNNTNISIIFYNIESFINLPKDSLYSLFLGSIEITNGCNLIATSSISLPLKLSIISFLCSFSGLSIIAQVSSFTSKHNISTFRYSLLKLLQGVVSFIITFAISKIFLGSIMASKIDGFSTNAHLTLIYLVPITLMVVLYLLSKGLKKLFFHIS